MKTNLIIESIRHAILSNPDTALTAHRLDAKNSRLAYLIEQPVSLTPELHAVQPPRRARESYLS